MNTHSHKVVEALGMLAELREGGGKPNYDAFYDAFHRDILFAPMLAPPLHFP